MTAGQRRYHGTKNDIAIFWSENFKVIGNLTYFLPRSSPKHTINIRFTVMNASPFRVNPYWNPWPSNFHDTCTSLVQIISHHCHYATRHLLWSKCGLITNVRKRFIYLQCTWLGHYFSHLFLYKPLFEKPWKKCMKKNDFPGRCTMHTDDTGFTDGRVLESDTSLLDKPDILTSH